MTSVIVLDASVLLKWVLPSENERHIETAQEIKQSLIKGSIELYVPSLWFYEVGNTLSRKHPHDAENSLLDLMGFCYREVPQRLILSTCIDIADKHQVTFYDASYHATAIVKNGTLITDDERYYEKTNSLGHIRLLSEYN